MRVWWERQELVFQKTAYLGDCPTYPPAVGYNRAGF